MLKFSKRLSAFLAAAVMATTLITSANAATVDTNTEDELVAQSTTSTQSVSLPLAQYPDGSYYSKTGKACSCHGVGFNPCSWNKSCDCINFDNAIQCAAFGRYIYYVVNGVHTYSRTAVYKDMTLTAANAKSTLQSLPVGTYLRLETVGKYEHSVSIAGTSSTGITIYHANMDCHCGVRYQTLTWAAFAEKFNYLYSYIA